MQQVNEFDPELAGTGTGLANWAITVSAPRQVMFGGHLGQRVATENAMVRNNLTGAEREYGIYTFGPKTKSTIRVARVVDKIPPRIGGVSVVENPLRTIIFREAETGRLGVIDVPLYHARHQSYGFKYNLTQYGAELRQGDVIQEGVKLAVSPSVKPGNVWAYGVEANVAFISSPATIEDGFEAAEEFLEESSFMAVKSNVVSWGSRYVALNLYGDEENYKPYPDPGERVKDHGILMALRRIDDRLSIVELSPKALMTVDYDFDKRIYAVPGALVTDIDVLHNVSNSKVRSLVGTETQPMKHYEMVSNYYRSILESYDEARREAWRNKTELTLSRELHALVVRARKRTATHLSKLGYRNAELDDFRVEISYCYRVTPTIGYKFTATHGDKGVIVAKRPRAQMPKDQWGNYADLILDGDSTTKRLNPGRLFEQYLNCASRHVREHVIELINANQRKAAWEYLYGYYSVASSAMKKMLDEYLAIEDKKGKGRKQDAIDYHLNAVLLDRIKLYVPVNLPEIGVDQIRNIAQSPYAPPRGPVSYINERGVTETTIDPVFIGSMYFMLLEKTGDDWSAVSSPKLQHFGFPAKLTKADKLSTPGHEQPVRFLGEDECRLISYACGGYVVAELLDQTNSPVKHRAIVTNISRADKPMNIFDVASPDEVPSGRNRAVDFSKHLLRCSGVTYAHSIGAN